MTTPDKATVTRGGRRHIARSRGALGGVLLVLLGAWGALVPFIGPYFDFAYTPDDAWTWTAARGWLEVLPGAAVVVGGVFMLITANRIAAVLGAGLAVAGGAWFVIGPELAELLRIGGVGVPTGSSVGMRSLESLAYFFALGAVIMFLAATAFGRLTIRSLSDVRLAQRREDEMRSTAPVSTQVEPAAVTPPAPAAAAPDDPVPGTGSDRGVRHGRRQRPLLHFGHRKQHAPDAAPNTDSTTSS